MLLCDKYLQDDVNFNSNKYEGYPM